MESQIIELLEGVKHPESGTPITQEGMVESISLQGSTLYIYIKPKRSRDPLIKSIAREVERVVVEACEGKGLTVKVNIMTLEEQKKEGVEAKEAVRKPRIGEGEGYKIIAIASGKGGVGKSTLTASLAVTMTEMGYKVGVLDGDIYGPSQHKIFGVEGIAPEVESVEGRDMIIPPVSGGVKVISMGMFIEQGLPLMWRGVMASSALTQLARDTKWGDIDFLLVDLPPGTGDIHLSLVTELDVCGAVVVSTPQDIALSDVRRGVEMLKSEKVQVPILGVVENMSFFTPHDMPERKYYIFGRGGAERYAKQEGLEFLGGVPIKAEIMEGCEGDVDNFCAKLQNEHYLAISEAIVKKLQCS